MSKGAASRRGPGAPDEETRGASQRSDGSSWRSAHLPAIVACLGVGVLLLLPVEPVLEWLSRLPLLSSWLEGHDSGQRLPSQTDKIAHVLMFGALSPFLHRSAGSWPGVREAPGASLGVGALAAVAYGGLLEVLQGWAGRSADPLDLVADAVGVAIYVSGVVLLGRS